MNGETSHLVQNHSWNPRVLASSAVTQAAGSQPARSPRASFLKPSESPAKSCRTAPAYDLQPQDGCQVTWALLPATETTPRRGGNSREAVLNEAEMVAQMEGGRLGLAAVGAASPERGVQGMEAFKPPREARTCLAMGSTKSRGMCPSRLDRQGN